MRAALIAVGQAQMRRGWAGANNPSLTDGVHKKIVALVYFSMELRANFRPLVLQSGLQMGFVKLNLQAPLKLLLYDIQGSKKQVDPNKTNNSFICAHCVIWTNIVLRME
jgi:hypothetical protein